MTASTCRHLDLPARTRNDQLNLLIVPTLCVGTPPGTHRVPTSFFLEADVQVTQSVTGCIPTQSVGTIRVAMMLIWWS